MGMLLAFAPFIVLDGLVGATVGLIAAGAFATAFLVRDWLSPNRTPKVLEIGTAILFGVLTIYALLGGPTSIVGVRLPVDAGLLLIVLVPIAIRRPFTLQYAREQVPREHWYKPAFIHTNYIITAAWGLAFCILVIADLILLYVHGLPPRVGIIVTVLALVAAMKFIGWTRPANGQRPQRQTGGEINCIPNPTSL